MTAPEPRREPDRSERDAPAGGSIAVPRCRPTTTAPDGLVVVDKPAGWTSHDVVARMRRLARTKKVGHAGTLDPMATGVLVLGIGRATRLLTYIVGVDKVYTATIRLGVTTLTDDAEGDLLALVDASAVTRAAIDAGVATLTGPIQQVPSAVSAGHVPGARAHRRGDGRAVLRQADRGNVDRGRARRARAVHAPRRRPADGGLRPGRGPGRAARGSDGSERAGRGLRPGLRCG